MLAVEDGASGFTEWAIVAIRPAGEGPRAEVVASEFLPSRAYVESSRDALVLVVTTGYSDLVFKAPLTGDAPVDRIAGKFRFRHPQAPVQATLSARLERTREKDLAPPKEQPRGDKEAAAPIRGLLRQLQAASEWADQRYLPLDLRLAQEAARDVPLDATTEEHLWAARRLAEAARLAGPPELADAAEAKLAEWRRVLTEEERPPSGPLGPRSADVRRAVGEDRIVLMELFTGAECGPCVAADRAFDALTEALRPTELITLQYHLHIPAPDPLANPDTVARAAYYDVASTPSTLFNGRPLARGGGPPAHALKKFNQYRRVIEGLLHGSKRASIVLEAGRMGDEVRIRATAEILKAAAGDRPRLRLALVDDEAPYEGGNGLKTHQRIVRALPGGPEGYALEDGRGRTECVIRLDQIRSGLAAYLAEYPDSPESRGRFPRALPPVEFRRLSVIAFVQDDAGKEVLHAVEAPVGAGLSEVGP